MTIRFRVYIATSLDGFIARTNGDLDWLLQANSSTEDYGYAAFMQTIDTLVIGRKTFETVLTYPEWPYAGKHVVVLSQNLTLNDVPAHLHNQFQLHRGPIHSLTSDLEAAGKTSVYVDGGQVIQACLAESRISELTITRLPVLIGSGIPLFASFGRDIRLEHVQTQSYANGLVQSTYRPIS